MSADIAKLYEDHFNPKLSLEQQLRAYARIVANGTPYNPDDLSDLLDAAADKMEQTR